MVVICAELSNNPGVSITNAARTARTIAVEVIEAYQLPTPPVWIEHHPPETINGRTESFEMVVFDSYEIRERRASYMGATGRWRSEALPGESWTGSVWICW